MLTALAWGALAWGALAASSLVVGALVGLGRPWPPRLVGLSTAS
jgi:ZIP family zinc transporter